MEVLFIVVKTQFEGIHSFPNAPEEVSFLRNPHRHIFHVEVEIEVFDDDRELEFIMVKRDLESVQGNFLTLGSQSCEMIARSIRAYLKQRYPISTENRFNVNRPRDIDHHTRLVNVKVMEDNENGAYLKEV